MSDTTAAPAPASSGFRLPTFSELGVLVKRGDLALAIGVLTILVVLILPLPPLLLDLALAVSNDRRRALPSIATTPWQVSAKRPIKS